MEPFLGIGCPHDNSNQIHAVLACRSGNAEFCLCRRSGFESRCPLIPFQKFISAGQGKGAAAPPRHMGNILHPYPGICKNFRVFYRQLPGHNGYVFCRCVMTVGIRQSAAVLKMGVHHSEFCRFGIHFLHKIRFGTRYMFRHRHRCIVTGSDDNAFNHGFQRLRFTFL